MKEGGAGLTAQPALGRRGVDDGCPGRARAIEARTRSEGEREEEQGGGELVRYRRYMEEARLGEERRKSVKGLPPAPNSAPPRLVVHLFTCSLLP